MRVIIILKRRYDPRRLSPEHPMRFCPHFRLDMSGRELGMRVLTATDSNALRRKSHVIRDVVGRRLVAIHRGKLKTATHDSGPGDKSAPACACLLLCTASRHALSVRGLLLTSVMNFSMGLVSTISLQQKFTCTDTDAHTDTTSMRADRVFLSGLDW